ncbi:MAG: hypothetical protein LBT01_03180 [Spirochaetaceae bacterium]|nr:hypothetical protein [Spirochaetaceae bacterium]
MKFDLMREDAECFWEKHNLLIIKDEEISIGNALHGIDYVLNNDFFTKDERLTNFTLM